MVLKSRENSIFDFSRDSVRNFAKMKSAQLSQSKTTRKNKVEPASTTKHNRAQELNATIHLFNITAIIQQKAVMTVMCVP